MPGCWPACPISRWSASSIRLPAHRTRATDLTGCRTFAGLDELIAEGVDAVTIAAPTHLHHEIALACIARDIHVLVEKPIASTVEEGREIVAAAERAGVTLMVGHVERFNPAVAAIKQAISGEDILSIAITRVGPFPPRMSNVGVVIDLAVHDIDLIRWFTESDIVEVQPQLSSAVAEREDIALLQFRTASGVLAHINTNWLTPFKARNVTVATRGKYVMGDLLTRQVTECFGFKPDGSYSMRHLPVGHDEPLRAELIAFLHAVRTGGVPAVTGDEGVASLEIATRCLENAGEARRGLARAQGAAARGRLAALMSPSQSLQGSMNQHLRPEPVPFIDLAAQRRRLGKSIDEAVSRVFAHCQFINGPEVDQARGRARRLQRGKACGELRERHRRAVDGADGQGRRPRRCGALSVLYLLRDRRGGGADRRDAGIRRCR